MCPCCISQEIDAAAKAEVSVEPKDVSDGALFGALASIVTSEAESQSTTVTMDVDASVQKEEAAAAEPLATEPDSVATSEAEQHSMTDEDLVDGAVALPPCLLALTLEWCACPHSLSEASSCSPL